MGNKELAVIIVNFNGKNYLKECLDSFSVQNLKNFELFLVDNASTDGSAEILKSYEGQHFYNKENLGFSGGNNLAIKVAIKQGFKFITLINPDTVLKPNTLDSLIKDIKKHPNAGAVQSRILIHGSNLINTTGNVLHFLGFSYSGDYKKPNYTVDSAEIAGASGAAVAYRAEALKKVGLLDEDFFMYLEDQDLSWRMHETGYQVRISNKSEIEHKYHFSRNKNKFYYAERNRLIFILKNYQIKTLVLLSPALLVTELLMLFYALFGEWLDLKIKGYGDIIRNFSKIKKERAKIQKLRIVSDHQLKRFWSKKLEFEEVSSPLFIPLNWFFQIYWFLIGWAI